MVHRERIEVSEVSDNIGAFILALGLKQRSKYTCAGKRWSLSNGVVVEMFKIQQDSLGNAALPRCDDWLVQIFGITRSDQIEHVVAELQKFSSMLRPFFVALVDDGKGGSMFPKELEWKPGQIMVQMPGDRAPQQKRRRTGDTWGS
jgi:hypothetical protein